MAKKYFLEIVAIPDNKIFYQITLNEICLFQTLIRKKNLKIISSNRNKLKNLRKFGGFYLSFSLDFLEVSPSRASLASFSFRTTSSPSVNCLLTNISAKGLLCILDGSFLRSSSEIFVPTFSEIKSLAPSVR